MEGTRCAMSEEESPLMVPLRLWTVEKLKDFLRKYNLPVTGVKAELLRRVGDCYDAMFFEAELDIQPFQQFHSESLAVPMFDSLPQGPWTKENFPVICEPVAKDYLKSKGGYTKNHRTGVRLCQCGHLYDIEMSQAEGIFYMRAKCRPTMRKTPPFYLLFIMVDGSNKVPKGGNCSCAAGASQSCVHVAALLFTLAEVTQTACTSVRCAWSRPSAGSKATFARELDFGLASLEGHFPYNGPQPPLDTLLESLGAAGCKPAIVEFLKEEREREKNAVAPASDASGVLQDPLDKLSTIALVRDPTVDDLLEALSITSEEAELIQIMTIGQRDNPLWMDARQWRITASNFGRVCNRNFRVMYPPSLMKILLGDYGYPSTAAIHWGCDHEEIALEAYQRKTGVEVDVCGIFLSAKYPFLGASPDGLLYVGNREFALVEVKCPYKHRNSSISDACKDTKFCLTITNSEPVLKRNHDYYFQVIGQLAITGAQYCDFIVWTLIDMHIERIFIDKDLWQEMTDKLLNYYRTELGPEIIRRLCEL